YDHIKDHDLATIMCRLGVLYPQNLPFTKEQFEEFRDILRTIRPDGRSVPVGWTRFPENADGATSNSAVSLTLALHDYLLVQSQLVAVGRVLDLAFHDDQVDADTAYDYKVETSWRDDHMRRLDHALTFEDQEPGQTVPAVTPWRNELAIGGMVDPRFEALAYPDARSTKALTFDCFGALTNMLFVEPVTEIQIWVAHAEEGSVDPITVKAFAPGFLTPFETISVIEDRRLLRFEAAAIIGLRFEGARVAISRLHYDRTPFPHGTQRALTCGLQTRDQEPLETPRDLQVATLPGGPVTVEGDDPLEKPSLAGLRWAASTDHLHVALSIHPIAYHVERADVAGAVTRLTEGAPCLLALDIAGAQQRTPPAGWPGRPYYLDDPPPGEQAYRIAAIDIFGRMSEFTDPVDYSPGPAILATPRDVRARYLDPAAYDAANDQLLDPLLTDADRDWLRDDGRPAIRVEWSWPAEIPAPNRDADEFRIVFQEGWQNVLRGIVDAAEGVSEVSIPLTDLSITAEDEARLPILAGLPASVLTLAFRTRLEQTVASDDLRLCWLKQGAKAFLVLTNTAGRHVQIHLLKMDPPADAELEPGQGFAITVTSESSSFVDYALPDSWDDQRVTATVERRRANQVAYEHLVIAPRFPDPPIGTDDLEPIRYGQLGVYAVRDATESAVSIPATVMAVNRQAPQAAALPFNGGTALRASPADIHGKARFALRWPKMNNGVKHHVLRALDESLFAADRAQGGTGDYASMTPNQLQALASDPGNDRAFTQLTQQPLREDDLAYADRVALPEERLSTPPHQPDASMMLYVDASLDGRSRNRYFYRLQAIDSGGLAGALGPATPPVEIPRTAPPPPPTLTAIQGGDRQITLRWVAQPETLTAGYLVYRSIERSAAADWRRMTKVPGDGTNGLITAEELTVAPDDSLAFVDGTAPPRQLMHYRVLAVGTDDAGKWLRSRPSAMGSGQAYDLTPPAPPAITSVVRQSGSQGEEIVVEWTCAEELSCMVQRRAEGAAMMTSSAWLDTGVYDETAALWRYQYVDQGSLNSQQQYVLTVQGRSAAGNVAVSAPSTPV
ncbi:MAG: hypothetical protein AAF637_03010, partial [Pseudomonadota bacterium]